MAPDPAGCTQPTWPPRTEAQTCGWFLCRLFLVLQGQDVGIEMGMVEARNLELCVHEHERGAA